MIQTAGNPVSVVDAMLVSMPVRAFLDSDVCDICGEDFAKYMFQCPSGHFLIQTYPGGQKRQGVWFGFNARQGIS